jgi:hypothetical protein
LMGSNDPSNTISGGSGAGPKNAKSPFYIINCQKYLKNQIKPNLLQKIKPNKTKFIPNLLKFTLNKELLYIRYGNTFVTII